MTTSRDQGRPDEPATRSAQTGAEGIDWQHQLHPDDPRFSPSPRPSKDPAPAPEAGTQQQHDTEKRASPNQVGSQNDLTESARKRSGD